MKGSKPREARWGGRLTETYGTVCDNRYGVKSLPNKETTLSGGSA